MNKAEELFHKIAFEIPESKEGKMFGALCLKMPNGKSGVMFWKDEMVFKLSGEDLNTALSLDGARLFDPMGGRPMKDWVQLPFVYAKEWKSFAIKGCDLVKDLKKT